MFMLSSFVIYFLAFFFFWLKREVTFKTQNDTVISRITA
jgi:hypothetical protein